jgi:hypothetical protein
MLTFLRRFLQLYGHENAEIAISCSVLQTGDSRGHKDLVLLTAQGMLAKWCYGGRCLILPLLTWLQLDK